MAEEDPGIFELAVLAAMERLNAQFIEATGAGIRSDLCRVLDREVA